MSFLGVSGSSMLSLLAVIENQISGVFPLLLPFPLKDFLPLGGVGLWYVELGCDVGVSILKGGHRFSVSSSLRILRLGRKILFQSEEILRLKQSGISSGCYALV